MKDSLNQKTIGSKISQSSKLFRFSEIINSNLSDNSIVGDFSRIINSSLKNYVRVDRFNLIYYSDIGDYSYTGMNDVIMHTTIGKFCSISWGITIGGGDHDYNKITTHDFLYNDRYGIKPEDIKSPYNRFQEKCQIGNDVWIGANSTILRGIKVSDGAVIGANTIVTKDVPPYAIVVGNPAKVIKYRFKDEVIEELLKLQWWNLPIEQIKSNYSAFITDDIRDSIKMIKESIK